MRTEFVMVAVDVYCKWSGEPPRYRCYVDDELFSERTWIWTDCYLEEHLQILASPGYHRISYELIDTENAKLKTNNHRIIRGSATVDQKGNMIIQESHNENT